MYHNFPVEPAESAHISPVGQHACRIHKRGCAIIESVRRVEALRESLGRSNRWLSIQRQEVQLSRIDRVCTQASHRRLIDFRSRVGRREVSFPEKSACCISLLSSQRGQRGGHIAECLRCSFAGAKEDNAGKNGVRVRLGMGEGCE